MTNWTELKRLAEEAGGIEWHADMAVANDGAESRAIYHLPKPYHVVEIIETPDSALDNADCIHSESVWKFIAAANPKTILSLIAENDRLREEHDKQWRLAHAGIANTEALLVENAKLRAEVEALNNECSALAAGVCDGVIGDDYGNAFCRFKSLLYECRRWVALAYDQGFEGAEELGERIESALKSNA